MVISRGFFSCRMGFRFSRYWERDVTVSYSFPMLYGGEVITSLMLSSGAFLKTPTHLAGHTDVLLIPC